MYLLGHIHINLSVHLLLQFYLGCTVSDLPVYFTLRRKLNGIVYSVFVKSLGIFGKRISSSLQPGEYLVEKCEDINGPIRNRIL